MDTDCVCFFGGGRGCQAGAVFHRKSGLGALPLALFNGVPLSSEEMDPDELETIILQRIMDATNFFQRAVFMVRAGLEQHAY